MDRRPVAAILGVTADIGKALANRLMNDGWMVVGFGRSAERIDGLLSNDQFRFVVCDISDPTSIAAAVGQFKGHNRKWSLFASSIGTMKPIGRFFELDFDQWEASFDVNSTAQLRLLHGLWPSRLQDATVNIMFLAGGGTNNALTNYSAYCLSKIALIKMCELIDDEEPLANAFIIGPGFVHTRIHQETLHAGKNAGAGYEKTLAFLKTEGTSFDDIYSNMRWCMSVGRSIAGGRNFSTVHDPWRNGGREFIRQIEGDPNALRLRRQGVSSRT
ncbi:SDR family oxidoreductase [Candidatus Kaiserbacteria bacterium]|nr:SDR family oxidoreductase [Candidatus Kaiserbacteria bacterium]